MLARPGLRRFLLFAGFGAVGTGVHYLTLILLVEVLGIGTVTASTVGYAVGALTSYLLNYRITFASSKRHAAAMSRFFVVAATGATINAIIMSAVIGFMGINYLIAQAGATAIVLVWNFLLNQRWTFAVRSRRAF